MLVALVCWRGPEVPRHGLVAVRRQEAGADEVFMLQSPVPFNTPILPSKRMSSTAVAKQRSDGRVESRVENYTKFWKKDTAQEGASDNENRLDSYTEVVNGQCPAFFGLVEAILTHPCRLLRRRDGAVRVWLVAVVPLLALLQGRGVPRVTRAPRALPRRADDAAPGHARARRWLRRRRACTRDRAVHGQRDRRAEQQRLPDPARAQIHEEGGPRGAGHLRQGRLHEALGAVRRKLVRCGCVPLPTA